jgi:hypothetical protein
MVFYGELLIFDHNRSITAPVGYHMNQISFWHRVAFIANCCWLATWGIRYYAFLPEGNIQSTIVVTGLVLAVGLNLLANVLTAVLFLRGRLRGTSTPRWLLLVNFLFLLPQLYLFFI